ncbi:MAG: hypothetical protein NTV03_02020 [Candidatus Nomurabacteria bacterium]|nr:hypothetical protein [Candidatus Nomurabacteria bacterium]
MQIIKNKNIKWWLGVASCVALFAIIGVFSYYKMSFVLNGVQIVASIEHNDNTSLAVISGKAQNATYISLNGREIYIDKDGSFSEKIALIPGFSVITIDAMDKFGKSKEKTFQLVYKEGSPLVAFSR